MEWALITDKVPVNQQVVERIHRGEVPFFVAEHEAGVIAGYAKAFLVQVETGLTAGPGTPVYPAFLT
jgi:hypothetical protein